MGTSRANPPALRLRLMETRAVGEFAAMRVAMPLLRRLPRGDGHPVLVLPGFTAGDRSTGALRRLLRDLGHHTHGWRLGRNIGPTPEVVDGLVDRLDAVWARDRRKVSLVGWSLGGIYARELGREFPERVRQVISLGSPFRMVATDRSAASGRWDSVAHLHDADRTDRGAASPRTPLPMPSTAVYTRTDGVVRWFHCLEDEGPRSENIEVTGSHCGLGFNPAAVVAVADRLAQDEGQWAPFAPPARLRRLYPDPATWQPAARPAA